MSAWSLAAAAVTHWVNRATWMVCLRLAVPSSRDAAMRDADAWLNEIAISPPHLLDWKPDQAVRIVVTDSSSTATSSPQLVPESVESLAVTAGSIADRRDEPAPTVAGTGASVSDYRTTSPIGDASAGRATGELASSVRSPASTAKVVTTCPLPPVTDSKRPSGESRASTAPAPLVKAVVPNRTSEPWCVMK